MLELKRKSKVRKNKSENKKITKSDSYHHGDLKSALIETALKMLKTKSPDQLSLRELAREAGVSQAAPYRHFKDKEELFAAIGQQGFEIKGKYMQDAIAIHKKDPLEMYFACGLSYFKMGYLHPQHFKLMFSSLSLPKEEHPGLMEAACATFILLRDSIKQAQEAGIVGEGDPYHRALNCWALVHGFTELYVNGRLDWVGVTRANAEKALRALLNQHLKGAAAKLDQKKFGFIPFVEAGSDLLKAEMEKSALS